MAALARHGLPADPSELCDCVLHITGVFGGRVGENSKTRDVLCWDLGLCAYTEVFGGSLG